MKLNIPQPSNKVVQQVFNFYAPIITYLLFWQVYFQLLRAAFFIYHHDQIFPIKPIQFFKTFWYGIHVDLTFTSYLMGPLIAVFFFQLFSKRVFYKKFIQFYSISLLIITSLIALIDLELYSNWGFKINKEVLFYLQFPKEALASIHFSSSLILLFSLYVILMCALVYWFTQNLMSRLRLDLHFESPKKLKINLCSVLFLAAITAVGARGGTNQAPFNASYVYFSNRPILNHTALNAAWNLTFSLITPSKQLSFHFMPEEEQKDRLNQLYKLGNCPDTNTILNTNKPNVVLVILEGWTADVIQPLGGIEKITPQFNSLVNEGLLFRNFYASGDRTYKGLPALLSGFPSLPSGSVIKYTDKMEKLPSLSASLNALGYNSSFFYGGELSFANIRAYIQHCGYENVIDKFHFSPSEYFNYKWGIHDHLLFNRVLKESKTSDKPFFTTILTQSSHEPYTVPMKTVFEGKHKNELFKNAVYYTDKSLGEFMKQAKEQLWYSNTLFIFVADHGKNLPLDRQQWSPEMFKIPLLFYGEVIKNRWRGKGVDQFGSQTDLATTLLAQLNQKSTDFSWGKNLLTCHKSFAFYNYNGGFGWVSPSIEMAYDLSANKVFYKKVKDKKYSLTEETENAKAYLQKLGQDFNQL